MSYGVVTHTLRRHPVGTISGLQPGSCLVLSKNEMRKQRRVQQEKLRCEFVINNNFTKDKAA